jgi:iron only hydrogenase large subunit-like protein
MLKLITEKCEAGFKNIVPAALDATELLFSNITADGSLSGGAPGSSGGVLEYVFCHAAKALFGVEDAKLDFKTKRNKDFQELTCEVEAKVVLCFAKAYGFRNIQNIVRKLKSGKQTGYHFVEVMACPGGCTNGGGQIAAELPQTPKQLAAQVAELYSQREIRPPEQNQLFHDVYSGWLKDDHVRRKEMFHTEYHAREAFQSALTIKW